MTLGMSGRCFKWNQNAALCISGLQKLAKGSLNEAFRGRAPMVGLGPDSSGPSSSENCCEIRKSSG